MENQTSIDNDTKSENQTYDQSKVVGSLGIFLTIALFYVGWMLTQVFYHEFLNGIFLTILITFLVYNSIPQVIISNTKWFTLLLVLALVNMFIGSGIFENFTFGIPVFMAVIVRKFAK